MTHEQDARSNHRSGYNCAQSITVAFASSLGLSPAEAMQNAPKPRADGGKCGAYLAGCQLLSQLNPQAVAEFERRFIEENGDMLCGKLRKTGIPCNDLVGCAARLVEALI